MHAWVLAVGLLVKLIDQPGALALTGGRVDDFVLVATWPRALDGRTIPVAERGLFLLLEHPRETYSDCSSLVVRTDRGVLPSTTQIERGGPTCGPEGREAFTLRVARENLASVTRAKTLAIDLCGTQLAVDRRWLKDLQRLVAKALADK